MIGFFFLLTTYNQLYYFKQNFMCLLVEHKLILLTNEVLPCAKYIGEFPNRL